jgi:hypothetical protein
MDELELYGSLIKIEKIFFFNFCNSNLIEHGKCSEMCIWIVGFGQNLRKWD